MINNKAQTIWMRRVIGVMIILLCPLSVLFGLFGINVNPEGWWYSVSDTYYATSAPVMISIIAICSFFMCTYNGYDIFDRIVNVISGLGLAVLVLFPCKNKGLNLADVGIFQLPSNISSICHLAGTYTAFIGFFINVMFLFTKHGNELTENKKKRNLIYRICGMSIPVVTILIILHNINIITLPNTIWIAEFIALTACGIAWLVKSEAIAKLND